MKYHAILTPVLTSLCLLTSHNTLANNVKEERWFEIEVIIFKQLADNSKNTEQFSSNDLRARKSKARDLLASYLQPDITSLKQLLPHCGQQEAALPYELIIPPYSLLTASDNTQEHSLQSEGDNERNITEAQPEINDTEKSAARMSVTVIPETNNEAIQEVVDNNEGEQDDQAVYTELELPIYNQYPIDSKTPLCVIPEEFFQQHLTAEQLESYNFNGFPVEKLTSTINGLEQWRDDETGAITWASDSPYLISKDSLRLKSIASRIKRSRNYAPLLHLGWRQVGESKRKAKAMKLYAGEHLDLRYQQAMAEKYNQQQALEIQAILEKREKNEALMGSQMPLSGGETTQVTSKTIESSETFNEISIAEELRQQAKQQQLDTLFKQLSLLDSQLRNETKTNELDLNSETTQTMGTTQRIVEQLSSDISLEGIPLNANNVIDEQQQAIPPLQPWSIDGLFKVHLDHYLYIDTEFNIIEPTTASPMLSTKQKLANKELGGSERNKVISFKQDRRVITGEIHYFDHPHIGMVVQIRRFDPTKPADEAISQSKK